jgi:hypothetical protein
MLTLTMMPVLTLSLAKAGELAVARHVAECVRAIPLITWRTTRMFARIVEDPTGQEPHC